MHFRIPDFYINHVVGICGNNNFDRSDDFTTSDGIVLEHELNDETVPALGSQSYYRTPAEYHCAESWKIGKVNKF